jgi:molecular chaperone Hsp33
MNDTLIRYNCPSLNVRAYTTVTQNVANELCKIHDTTPNATYAFANSITAASLLSANLKPDSNQSLVYKIDGKGPLKSLYIQINSFGHIRGYVKNPGIDYEVEIGSIDFSKAIGAGTLTVVKELGLKEPYSGISPLLYGSVAQDTAYYLLNSEQVPSAIIIGCKTHTSGDISASGGIMIQSYPDTDDGILQEIESRIRTAKQDLGEFLETGGDITLYLSELLDTNQLDILSDIRIEHRCSCGKEIVLNSLKVISSDELKKMIHEDNGAEISCTFCRTKYQISVNDIQNILDSRKENRS